MTTPDPQPLTSSPPRPRPRPEAVIHRVQGTGETTSSPVPLFFEGDEVGEPSAGRGHDVVPNPGTKSLITPRTAPFWKALHDTLVIVDHLRQAEIVDIGQRKHKLAPRTITNLLARAGKRRWIKRTAGVVRLRDRAAFEAALLEAGDG